MAHLRKLIITIELDVPPAEDRDSMTRLEGTRVNVISSAAIAAAVEAARENGLPRARGRAHAEYVLPHVTNKYSISPFSNLPQLIKRKLRKKQKG